MANIFHSSDPMVSITLEGSRDAIDNSKNILLQVDEISPSLAFTDLPREIRDYIYGLIFLSEERIYPNKKRARISDYLGILRTNHQIYSEVVEVLYGRNTFHIRGEPPWTAPEFLNLVSSQRRDGYVRPSMWAVDTSKVCIARHHLRRLWFPSHNTNIARLKHLFSLLKYFPNLEHLHVVYSGSFGVRDMDVVDICRLFRDRRPLVEKFTLYKRIKYTQAEDISWMLWEKPYRTWNNISNDPNRRHMWRNQDGQLRRAAVVDAPQNIPE